APDRRRRGRGAAIVLRGRQPDLQCAERRAGRRGGPPVPRRALRRPRLPGGLRRPGDAGPSLRRRRPGRGGALRTAGGPGEGTDPRLRRSRIGGDRRATLAVGGGRARPDARLEREQVVVAPTTGTGWINPNA